MPKPEHVNFIELTGGQGCERLQAFFRELRERGAALCWGVELPFGAGSEVLNFFGLAREGNVSLVSSRDPKELFALHNKLQGTTHEIPFILQPLHQKALASVHNQPPGNWAFDEFMNLNNELINAKRELSKNEHKLKQQASHEREVLFESLFEHSPVGLAIVGLDFLIQRANSEFCRITGYTRQELERLEFSALAHNDDLLTDIEHTRQLEVGLIDQYTKDKRYLAKGGDITWVHVSLRLIRDDTGRPQYYLPMILDINGRKMIEDELRKQTIMLGESSSELGEINTALRILLDQRDKDRLALHDQVRTNMGLLIVPYLERLRRECPQPSTGRLLTTIQRNFHDITSSFARTLGSEYRILSANEIRVADLIRSGMSSKDIASMLNISPRTAEYYRAAIRRKLGLRGKRANLYAHLNTLANTNPDSEH